ncbi:MAG: hypothetical protein WBQ29_25730 [Isosphaeraceae bacterium]|jgi:hypothetical protein
MRIIDRFPLALLLACCLGGCEGETSTNQAPPAATLTPKIRAAMDLNMARKMEKLKQRKAALDAYRRISQEFPESPEAKVASERIRALEGN